eukprot:2214316-Amphidinium_carterae.1
MLFETLGLGRGGGRSSVSESTPAMRTPVLLTSSTVVGFTNVKAIAADSDNTAAGAIRSRTAASWRHSRIRLRSSS